jgi:hypothetical protein
MGRQVEERRRSEKRRGRIIGERSLWSKIRGGVV